MFKLKQCLGCNNLRLTRNQGIAVCTNCGDRFDEKALGSVLRQYSCGSLDIARKKAQKNKKLQQQLNDIGVL